MATKKVVRLIKRPTRVPYGTYRRPTGSHLYVEVFGEETAFPKVHISSLAHGKMRALINAAVPNEISWLPSVEILKDGSVRIVDIFVPGQICGLGTTDVTPDGESELYSEMISAGQANTIKTLLGWGHSHVDFDVFASGLDNQTTNNYVRDFRDRGKTHFVRLIANRYDDMYASIYFPKEGKAVHHAPIIAEATVAGNYHGWAREQLKKVMILPVPKMKKYSAAKFAALLEQKAREQFNTAPLLISDFDFPETQDFEGDEYAWSRR